MKIQIDVGELVAKIRPVNGACQKFVETSGKTTTLIDQAVQMGGHPKALIELGKSIKANGDVAVELGASLVELMDFLQKELESGR